MSPNEPILTLREVSAGYGGRTNAVEAIDLELHDGEIRGIVGANGAGKSTLLKVLGGNLAHRSGTITHRGNQLRAAEKPAKRLRSGICLLPEGHRVVPTLTVKENLSLATITNWPRGSRSQFARNIERIHELFPVLKDREHQYAGHLSGGEQQMVSIGRAIMAEPDILLLDEPSLGLAPAIVDRIYQAIVAIADGGVSFIIVEQNHTRLATVCQQIDVLRLGRIVQRSDADKLDLADLQSAYFGTRSPIHTTSHHNGGTS